MFALVKKFLWALPFVCFIAGYLFLTKLYPAKEFETPIVVGKTLQEACTILARQNLNSRLIALKEDPLLPDGTIISQTPQAGQKIKPNQAVFIVASTQPEKNSAPDYVQKPLSEFEPELAAQNIRAKIYSVPSTAQSGICIAQWPEADLPLENNKMILYVSQTINKPIIIPNVKNKPVLEVINFLKTNGIQTDVIHTHGDQEENHTCAECIILDQRPLAGSIIALDPQKPLRMQLQVK